VELTTKRLRITALSLANFSLLLHNPGRMEAASGPRPSPTPLDAHTHQAMQWLYDMAATHPEDHLWYTNWQISLNAYNQAIGSACFKGAPNGNGEVELGYGIDAAHRNNGYMTEAVAALSAWALWQPGVRAVVAETDRDNPASQRVCQKCGMNRSGETPGTFLWKLSRKE